jgi:hypothetical protein
VHFAVHSKLEAVAVLGAILEELAFAQINNLKTQVHLSEWVEQIQIAPAGQAQLTLL